MSEDDGKKKRKRERERERERKKEMMRVLRYIFPKSVCVFVCEE